ncbi:MAG: MBL fold metallo-hydrolase [Polyangiales bacterium]
MSLSIDFQGAARTVTGSMHLLRTSSGNVLLDCGLYQGRRKESFERNRHMPIDPHEVHCVVLSHAHIDHSGALPILVKNGFRGTIYATPATRDLCAAMLEDAANIQLHDAKYIERQINYRGADMEPVEPLYDLEDVARTLSRMVAIPYHHKQRIAPGVDLTFHDAGHVLGSALVALDVDDEGLTRKLLFSGDLGRRGGPILRDPEIVPGVEFLILESTYGDRLHGTYAEVDDTLARVIRRVYDRGGKLVVPTFALERAQEVMLALSRIRKRGLLPPMKVYVDSPLTVKVTDIFRLHPECFDEETRALLATGHSPFEFPELEFIQSVEDSKRLDREDEPMIILSASGMCENGRVLHHLKAILGDARHAICIVGFQAQHTLGRRLVEGRTSVRIFGVEQPRLAEVVVLNGMSAHADRNDLLWFAESLRKRGPLREVALVHGEPQAQEALREALDELDFPTVHIPEPGQTLTF